MFEKYDARDKAKKSLLYTKMESIISKNGTWGMYQFDERASSSGVRNDVLDLALTHELVEKRENTFEFDEAKKLATSFFYWWYNQTGSNTEDGFDDWWDDIGKFEFGGKNVEEKEQA